MKFSSGCFWIVTAAVYGLQEAALLDAGVCEKVGALFEVEVVLRAQQ